MKQTINQYQFTEAFRAIRPDNFSYEGLKTLFNYLEELEQDLGEELELDVIAICCDWTQFDNLAEFNACCGTSCEFYDEVLDYTTALQINNSESFIIQNF